MKQNKYAIISICLAVICVGLAFFGGYYYNQYQLNQKTDSLTAQQVEHYTEALSKIIVIPTDEKPVVALVNDANTLASQQTFFSGAENDDILFVYSKAGKAFIYRPTQNKVINVGPLQYTDNNTNTQ